MKLHIYFPVTHQQNDQYLGVWKNKNIFHLYISLAIPLILVQAGI